MTANTGSGPGEITPDGCPVEFYALLPLMGEPEIVHSAAPDGGSLLELGCGTGRLLRPLARLGHRVTGVDESPAMLAHVTDLPTVRSSIETLDLAVTFDVVLLASTMINTAPDRRREFLATCRRHVDPTGVVVFQQSPDGWFDTLRTGTSENAGVRREVTSVERDHPRTRLAVEYRLGTEVWTHTFDRWVITDLAGDLAAAGLRLDRRLSDDGSWFTARPA